MLLKRALFDERIVAKLSRSIVLAVLKQSSSDRVPLLKFSQMNIISLIIHFITVMRSELQCMSL